MSEDGLINVKYKILELFSNLDEDMLDSVEQWISSKSYKTDMEKKKSLLNADKKLLKISNTIKKIVPFDAVFTTEKIATPNVGNQVDCNEINTLHIDEFLYDEEDVDKLVEKGKLTRHYCLDCNSRNTKELIYISHSLSRQTVQHMFNVLLPQDLADKQVLDVGSRLGAVLFGAYYFSNAGTIVGVEMNKECCEIQELIINQFSIDNKRVKIVHSDILERSDIVSNSDVIVINVPDFFVDTEKHKEMWYFFKKYIKKGSYIACTRSVVDVFQGLDIFEELMSWLSICRPNQQENEIYFDFENDVEIFLYTVN